MNPSSDLTEVKARLAAAERALDQAQYAVAKPILLAALSDLEKKHADDGLLATCLLFLGLVHYRGSEYEEAEPLFRRAVSLQEGLASPTLTTAVALAFLAQIQYPVRGNMAEAERLYQSSLAIHAKVFEQSRTAHPSLIQTLSELANLYYEQGRFAEAEQALQMVLDREKHLRAPHPPATAGALKVLAKFRKAQHQYAEAARYLEQALSMLEKALGPDDYRLGSILCDLGSLYLHSLPGREREAWTCFERASILVERAVGPYHPDILPCLEGVATFLQLHGQYAQAKQVLRHALAVTRKVYGREHYYWAIGLAALANLYNVQGKYAKAERYTRRALVCARKVLGHDHPEVSKLVNNLATFCFVQGRSEEAETLYRQALVNREEVLGPDHPQLLPLLRNYIKLLRRTGRKSEAAELSARVSAIQARPAPPLPLDLGES